MARFPLQALLDHSRHRMEAAERLLRMLRRKEDEAAQRLEQLRGFRGDYHARLTHSSSAGMSILQFRDYQAFLAKIEVAIRHQQEEVAQAHSRWEHAHGQWLEQRQKVKAYETLATRHHTQEVQRQDRREQKAIDEHANQRAAASGEDKGLA